MEHPFKDKIVVFIGNPGSCTLQSARDTLAEVGGIFDKRVGTFTNYAVAFPTAEKTQKYQKALELERHGLLSILTEEQFLAILAGEAQPPKKPKRDNNVIFIPAKDAEVDALQQEETKQMILNRRRMNNLAEYGVSTPEGRVKVDLRPLDKYNRVLKRLKEKEQEASKS